MKLSVLLLPSLITLCSAAPQNFVKENSQIKEDIHLNPDLKNRIPELTADGPSLALLTPAELVQNRTSRSLSSRFPGSILKWQTSYGSAPPGAVGFYNSHAERYDYICKYGCSAGFFNPDLGPRCRYPYEEKELLGYPFEVLVNKDHSESLEWRDESGGGVPQYSVMTCFGQDVYVGRNKFGLGKVHARHEAFFLPWEGREYWYKDYQVLTLNTDLYQDRMENVRYHSTV